MKFNPRFVTAVLICLTLTTACNPHSKSRSNDDEAAPAVTETKKDKPKTDKKMAAEIELDPEAQARAEKAAQEATTALKTEMDVEAKTEIFLHLVKSLKLPRYIVLEELPGFPKQSAFQKATLKDCKIIKTKLHSGPENLITKEMKSLNPCWGKAASFDHVPNTYLASHHLFVNEMLSRPKDQEPSAQEIIRRDQFIFYNAKQEILGITQKDLKPLTYEIMTKAYLPSNRIGFEKRVTQIKEGDSVIQLSIDDLNGAFKFASTVKGRGKDMVEARYKLTYITNPVRKLSVDFQSVVLNEKSSCQIRVLEGEKVVFENTVESCGFHQ